jgi:hypothetical protein
MVTNYFKEFVSTRATNFKTMDAEKFEQLCQACSFLK